MIYKSKRLHLVIVLAVVVLSLLLVQGSLTHMETLKAKVPGLIKQIQSYPVASPLLVFLLAVIQSIVPVLPFFLLAGASGALFGIITGLLLVWSGAVVGALVVFLGVRYFGRDRARAWLEGLAGLGRRPEWSPEKGFIALLLARLIPIVPSSAVNVVCGLSRMKAHTFLAATAMGKLPWALLYTSLGYNLQKGNSRASIIALLILLLMLFSALIRWPKRTT
ncbi:MAG TPA: TVP38/TMEM64 family protein [Bacillota bacterium]|nr:TVP38/TMEM64 family protein [Bacillota bacterium]